MHAWARWALVLVVCALSASVVAPARASFPEACTPAYLATFDERFDDVPYDCVERIRVEVPVRGRTATIRIIHDSNIDWAAGEADLARFDAGIRAAADGIRQLGDIDLMDITVLLADDFPPPEGDERFSNINAWSNAENPEECRVTVFVVGASPENAMVDVAHEIFHCVQSANLTAAQNATSGFGLGTGGDWWIEGSAEWFAALALPDAAVINRRVSTFDEASQTVPLIRMAYGTAVFFAWLGAEESPPGVMRFLHGMAESTTDAAQRSAMGAVLSQERWLDFAQAYLDRTITDPHGRPVAVNPTEGDVWEWSASQTRTASLEPFLLHRGVVAFQCGRWSTGVNPGAMHRARLEDGGAWASLPDSIDTSSGSGGSYRFAAINARGASATLSVRGTKETGCDCAGVSTLDACVVGIWQLTGGGPAEWLRSQGMPDNISVSNGLVHFRADGTFVTAISRADIDQRFHDDVTVAGQVRSQATGRWSTSGGRLNLCEHTQAGDGGVVIVVEGDAGAIPWGGLPPRVSSEAFTCAGGTLNTQREMEGMSPMPFNYTRIGG